MSVSAMMAVEESVAAKAAEREQSPVEIVLQRRNRSDEKTAAKFWEPARQPTGFAGAGGHGPGLGLVVKRLHGPSNPVLHGWGHVPILVDLRDRRDRHLGAMGYFHYGNRWPRFMV